MMYLQHITLTTGHVTRIQRGDVTGETLARVGPWLAVLVESGAPAPLPVSEMADYGALAVVIGGALIVTISGPNLADGPMAGKAPPLVSIGIAERSRQGADLWSIMTGPVMPAPKQGLQRPPEPWCAVAIWPTIALHPDCLAWIGDLERCIAWAWLERPRP